MYEDGGPDGQMDYGHEHGWMLVEMDGWTDKYMDMGTGGWLDR